MSVLERLIAISSTGAALAALASFPVAFAQSTERVSLGAGALEGDSGSRQAAISTDGRFVAFVSSATNLVAGDLNGLDDIFLHDRSLGTTTLISVDSFGAQANGASFRPAVSGDGRYVVFESDATNLDALDTNGTRDVFLRDTVLGVTTLISLTPAGTVSPGPNGDGSLTPDGLFAAFRLESDIYVRDLTAGVTTLVSVDQGGVNPAGGSFGSSMSADGRFVAFASLSSNVVSPDTNGTYDVFVRDTQLGVTFHASVDTFGVQANGLSGDPAMSPCGRYVGYFSAADNLVAGDTNGKRDVFVHDLQSGLTSRVSLGAGGVEGDGLSRQPSLSMGGRYIAFYSMATNLVANDLNGAGDIFVRDTLHGVTQRVSVDSSGIEGNDVSAQPSLTALGRLVAFHASASNLVASDLNAADDVFVRDLGPELPFNYCTAAISTFGCVATISASANPSLTLANTCLLTVTGVEGQKQGLIYYGLDITGFNPSPWGNGFRCAKSPIKRTGSQNSNGNAGLCDGSYTLDWDNYHVSNPAALGNPWTLWERAYVQAWYRDPPSPKASNFSDALVLTYQP